MNTSKFSFAERLFRSTYHPFARSMSPAGRHREARNFLAVGVLSFQVLTAHPHQAFRTPNDGPVLESRAQAEAPATAAYDTTKDLQTGSPPVDRPTRSPLKSARAPIIAPASDGLLTAEDPRTGELISYDPKYRVEITDAKSGSYVLRWQDERGLEGSLHVQRPDAIDLVVIASVAKIEEGEYEYTYELVNLPSSGQFLSGFAVQALAPRVEAVRDKGVYVGSMSNRIPEFSKGTWISFGIPYFGKSVTPGTRATAKIRSSSPPGLVECRATGGEFVLRGDAERMPPAIQQCWPTYRMWPKGHTLGPVQELSARSLEERREYIRNHAEDFVRLGWLSPSAGNWLSTSPLDEASLRGETYQGFLARGEITSEVQSLLQHLLA